MRNVAIAFFLAVASLAPGDGAMFAAKPTAQLVEAPPKISSQRAVLKFDGRGQTMIVESVLDAPPGRYGWVVPLPTRPSFVKAVKPEYVSGTFAAVKPKVQPLRETDLRFPIAASLLVTAVLLTAGRRYRRLESEARVLLFLGEMVLGALVLSYAFASPSYEGIGSGTAGGGFAAKSMASESAGVQVESLGTIGSYEVSVLTGERGRPLAEWLRKHDIDVPESAQRAIDQYTQEGWCFLAAEFRKDQGGSLPPHPLKAVFPTDKLIYPMRLTGTQAGPLRLELAVVGARRAEVEGMRVWSCNDDPVLVAVNRDPHLDKEVFSEWEGSQYAMSKHGGIVTYLRGDLTPGQMQEDFTVSWKPYERFQVEVRDRGQAANHALKLAALWLPLGAALFGFLAVLAVDYAAKLMAAGAVASLIIASAAGGTWYGSVEKVDTEETTYSGHFER